MNGWTANLLCGAAIAMAGVVPDGRADERPPLKLFAPETWEAAVAERQRDLDKLTEALIAIATDEVRRDEDRLNAVILLGKIGNERALDFLVKNVEMVLPKIKLKGTDADLGRQLPCYGALLRFKGDWRVAQPVLRALDTPKTERELSKLFAVFQESMGDNLGLAVIEQELAKRPNADRKKNLEAFRDKFPK